MKRYMVLVVTCLMVISLTGCAMAQNRIEDQAEKAWAELEAHASQLKAEDWYNAGMSFENAGAVTHATQAYERAVGQDLDHFRSHLRLYYIYRQGREVGKSGEHFTACYRINDQRLKARVLQDVMDESPQAVVNRLRGLVRCLEPQVANATWAWIAEIQSGQVTIKVD